MHFDSLVFIYLLAFVVLPFLIFTNAKLCGGGEYNPDFLSKHSTDCLRGLCMLVIVLHHVVQKMRSPELLEPFRHFGHLAVSVFFVLSGYSLMVSMRRDRNTLRGFIKKRLRRVYLPFVIVNILTIAALYFFRREGFPFGDMLLYVSGIRLIDPSLWFVVSIMVLYAGFYLSFKLFSGRAALLSVVAYTVLYFAACVNSGLDPWWYNTVFCFPAGVLLAAYSVPVIAYVKQHYSAVLFSAAAGAAVSFVYNGYSSHYPALAKTMASSIFFAALVVVLLLKVRLSSKALYFVGGISFEIYILHMKVFEVYQKIIRSFSVMDSVSIYFYLGAVVLLAVSFKKFTDLIRAGSGVRPLRDSTASSRRIGGLGGGVNVSA